MKDGAAAGFKYFDFDGLSEITVSVRGEGIGYIEVKTKAEGKPICVIPVNQAGDWKDFSAAVNDRIHGKQALYMTYRGTGFLDFSYFTVK